MILPGIIVRDDRNPRRDRRPSPNGQEAFQVEEAARTDVDIVFDDQVTESIGEVE